MLWSLSASLIRTTLTSSAMAISILRTVAARACLSCEPFANVRAQALSESRSALFSFVTPSTSRATSPPNLAVQLLVLHAAVLHDVVQQGRRQRVGVQPQVGQVEGGVQGVI